MFRKLTASVTVAAAALAGAAPALATPVAPATVQPVASAPTTQGIIMSDGRICNPRWGC